jgi:hypothetical protein
MRTFNVGVITTCQVPVLNVHRANAAIALRIRNRIRKHTAPTCLVMMLTVASLLAPPASNAQQCKGNIQDGCLDSGAVCSPVTKGLGSKGHCATTPNLPPGERECECAGTPIPPPPALDPKCSDRTAQGKIVCTINEPIVTQHETTYSMIEFAPKDIVDVSADGCVQTGGTGATWKRYVNPSGPKSANLYHGLVRILTGTEDSALVRINTVIEKHLQVTGTNVPVSQLVLHLGYEDDDYSDNGYYSHDNGTDDQCKSDSKTGTDGGPAHVTITIYRGVQPGAPTSHFDFDVVSAVNDPNGLPYNPLWTWQTRPENQGKIPNTSICHDFSTRESTLGFPNEFMSPSFADCTDQADISTVDIPIGTNGLLCNYGSVPYFGSTFAGHVNWFPVTLEGNAFWGDHSGLPYPFGDDDYTFTYTAGGQTNPLSVNGRGGLHVEFDSDETIDHFSSDEWNAFHNAVDNNNTLADQLFDGHTILTGMFGLDGEHGMKAELHPLFALSTRRTNYENDPTDDVWLMFVRNQGDEGYCSSQIWDLGLEDYTVKLPWLDGMTSVEVNWDKTQFVGTDGTSGPTVSAIPPPSSLQGVYVTFHLGPAVATSSLVETPASVPFINGALHLVWTGATLSHPVLEESATRVASVTGVHVSGQLTATTGATPEVETDNVERMIQTAVQKLPDERRPTVQKARTLAGAPTAAVHRLAPTGPVRKITERPAIARVVKLHAISGGPANQKLARDAAQIKALCAASNNAPAGLPANVCTPATVEHH